ncbi:aldo/keto reductase [Oceanomicrobium pacificus]|uniref:Aldo/keto reductase n=1 Tax=Oceanomicrobium pacificus TaxID=2692916 RepID=A0A6B0TUS4_9RHOB|nr:aldo/keto reductase [Oceanomicrobium pacificus]MXU64992.1 aldo/keto reductase [Oceanomicrobium pacificus]
MKMNTLGRSGIEVSEICLGSMTWGTQNSEAEGHEQMSYAADQGVNFIDTAELYPTNPISGDTQGRTEEIIGTWFKAQGNRDRIVLASKVTGPGPKWIRDGGKITPQGMEDALHASLKRLDTDYIDLYQIHWPNRGSYHFRQSWTYRPHEQDRAQSLAEIEAILETAQKFVDQGKIRMLGLSNETVWGTAKYLQIAEAKSLPRVVSMQNEYSLMHRIYDLDFAELSHHEEVGLLAYSPLAAGMLSGKYEGGEIPAGSRRSIAADLGGRATPRSLAVVTKYVELAKKHGLDPSQMALAFCIGRPFMTSTIIGATSMDQLKTDLGAAGMTLSDEVQRDIQAIYKAHPIPM